MTCARRPAAADPGVGQDGGVHLVQRADAGRIEVPGEVPVDRGDEGRPGSFEDFLPLAGEAGVDGAPVVAIAIAIEQASLFEPVNRLGHRAFGDVEPGGDLDHPQPPARCHGDSAQHQVVGEGQSGFGLQVAVDGHPDRVDRGAELGPCLQAIGPPGPVAHLTRLAGS